MYILIKGLRITTAYKSIINRSTNGLRFCTRCFCHVTTALLCFTPTFLSGATLPFLLKEHKFVIKVCIPPEEEAFASKACGINIINVRLFLCL